MVDSEDHAARMHRLLRLHYGAGRVCTVVDRGSRSAVWYSVNAYFAGELTAINGLPVETGGTVFQRSVWAALRKIPVGQTLSYGALATRAPVSQGRPSRGARQRGEPRGHSRAVSSRGEGLDGSLTGYGGGVAPRKRWLLNHEGVGLAWHAGQDYEKENRTGRSWHRNLRGTCGLRQTKCNINSIGS